MNKKRRPTLPVDMFMFVFSNISIIAQATCISALNTEL